MTRDPLMDEKKAPKHLQSQGRYQIDVQELHAIVRNFHEVTSYLYRGGQPDARGIEELAKAGIKTIVCLRTGDNALNAERKAAESLGMKFISLPIHYWWFPPVEITAKFLEIADDEKNWPVFVHCMHGMDRTGLLCAMFRITRLGWHIDEAYREMKGYGFRRFRLRHFKWTLYQYARTLRQAPNCSPPRHEPHREKVDNALVVYNPKAGSAKHLETMRGTIESFLRERLGCAVTWHELSQASVPIDLSSERTYDLVVAVGGDGTVARVLEAVWNSERKIPIAIIPTGTSNLLARSLGVYPMKMHRSLWRYAFDLYFLSKRTSTILERALSTIEHGQPIELDLARVNGKIMVTSLSIGAIADATAAPSWNTKKSWGMFAYIAQMLKQTKDAHRKFLIRIDDEQPFEAEAMGVLVSNLPNFGIGTPEDLDQARDGLLDLFIVDRRAKNDNLRPFFKYIGWIVSNNRIPPYLFRRVKRIRATAMDDSIMPSIAKPAIAIDGDGAGHGPVDVEVISKAVTVYAPPWVAAHLKSTSQSACETINDTMGSDEAA